MMANTGPLDATAEFARPLALPRMDLRILLVAATILVVLLPVLLVQHPSGIDWPNHLARHAIGHGIAGSPILQQFYDYAPRLVANSGADLSIGLLAPLVGVEAAARGVLMLTLALWVLAPLALSRALHGRWSAWPLVASPFAWNMNVTMGFENYSLAAPLAVCAFAVWIAGARSRAGMVAFVSLAAAVYLGHIIAFGVLAVMVGAWEAPDTLRRLRREPRAVLLRGVGLAVLFLLPVLHFASMLDGNLPAEARLTVWGTIGDRIRPLLSPAFTPAAGLSAFVTIVAIFGLVASLASRGILRFDRRMGLVLLALTVLALLAPRYTLGIAFTDIRLPVVAMVVLVASFRFGGTSARTLATVAGAALVASTIAPLIRPAQSHDAAIASIREGFELIAPGSKVLNAIPTRRWISPVSPLTHAVAYAVVDRQAFVPALFTNAQFLTVREAHARLDHPVPPPIPLGLMDAPAAAAAPNDYWHGWREDFDHVLLTGRLDDPSMVPAGLVPIHSGPAHTLFRIERPSGEGARP